MSRRLAALGVVGLAVVASACTEQTADLADTLSPVRGRIEDANGREASVDDLLAAARGRPVTVSFAYVGCSGGTPRLERLRSAEAAVGGENTLHVVLNAVDEPSRYGEVVRDLTGEDAGRVDPDKLRILFVDKGELWPQQPSAAVEGVMQAIGLRYGQDRFVETVRGIGVFAASGRLMGVRY